LKIAIITDTHFGKGNDSLKHDDHFRKFYTDFFFPTIEREGVRVLRHGGDLYDRRRFINFDILNRSRGYFVDPASSVFDDIEMALGNHDIYVNESSALNGASLLTNHLKNFRIRSRAHVEMWGGMKVLIIPWINKENEEETLELIKSTDAEYAFGHLDIHGFEMDKGQINKHGLDPSLFKKFKAVWTGHFHHKNAKDNIFYLGAPYEMTWADCDDEKGFYILDTDTAQMTYYRNPFTLYKKFYYDDVNNEAAIYKLINECAMGFEQKFVKIIIENRTQHDLFDTIYKLINAAGVHELSIVDKVPGFAISKDAEMSVSDEAVTFDESVINEDTGKIISSYVTKTTFPAHIDQNRVLMEMDALHREAQQLVVE
jgi:DNA repair exonuclease SbcCD nuclease subunit